MNKILLSLLLFTSVGLYGQTITSDWFFQPGDSFSALLATNPETLDLPKSGLDQIWDFSNLEGFQEIHNDYVAPSNMTQSSFFSDATVAFGLRGVQEIYYKVNEDSLLITGIYENTVLGEFWLDYFDGEEEILGLAPMMFGDTVIHDRNGEITGDGFLAINSTQQFSFEGMGTVYIPGDTIINVAYLKSELFATTGESVATAHFLMKNSFTNPIVRITEALNVQGTIDRIAVWQTDFEGDITSTEDAERLDFKVTSDPSGRVHINSEEQVDVNIQLINMNGQVVQSTEQLLDRGTNQINFTEVINSGQYTLFILDKKSGQFYTNQVAIIK